MLFGADPDFQYFRVPDTNDGRLGSSLGNIGYLAGGAAGIIRKGGSELGVGGKQPGAEFPGHGRYPGIDRFRDIR